jgi:hypothetical protein
MTDKPHDGPTLADRADIESALSRITGENIDSHELTDILRAVTGWNVQTCRRYARQGLPFDDRRRKILLSRIEAHTGHMEAFKQWLESL